MKIKVKLKSNGRPSKEAEERFLKAGAEIFSTGFRLQKVRDVLTRRLSKRRPTGAIGNRCRTISWTS